MAFRLSACGSNSEGQLGLGSKQERVIGLKPVPPPPPGPFNSIRSIRGGGTHTLILTDSQDVYVAGSKRDGRIGYQRFKALLRDANRASNDIIQNNYLLFEKLYSGVDFCAASSSASAFIVNSSKGARLVTQGAGKFGELGRGPNIIFSNGYSQPHSTDEHKTDWAEIFRSRKKAYVKGWKPNSIAVDIAGGQRHFVVILSNGEAWGWGYARNGQLGPTVEGQNIFWAPKKIEINFHATRVVCGRNFTYIVGYRQPGTVPTPTLLTPTPLAPSPLTPATPAPPPHTPSPPPRVKFSFEYSPKREPESEPGPGQLKETYAPGVLAAHQSGSDPKHQSEEQGPSTHQDDPGQKDQPGDPNDLADPSNDPGVQTAQQGGSDPQKQSQKQDPSSNQDRPGKLDQPDNPNDPDDESDDSDSESDDSDNESDDSDDETDDSDDGPNDGGAKNKPGGKKMSLLKSMISRLRKKSASVETQGSAKMMPSEPAHIMLTNDDKNGLLSDMPQPTEGLADIGATWGAVFRLMDDGTISCWGRITQGQRVPENLPAVRKMAVGSEHVLVITEKTNKVLGWGWAEHGNIGDLVNGELWNGNFKEFTIPFNYVPEVIGCGWATSFVLGKTDSTIRAAVGESNSEPEAPTEESNAGT